MSGCERMRRLSAFVQALIFFALTGAPILTAYSAEPDSNLPACCRRDGKHHCMMLGMGMGGADSGSPVLSEQCPYSPFTGVRLMRLPHALFSAARPAGAGEAASPDAVVGRAEAGYRISFNRERQKRGPPKLLQQ